jgi:hypothetical protein
VTAAEGTTGRRISRGALALGLVATIIAVLLYRPWSPRPFDTVDFSEFLHILTGEGGPWDRLRGMVQYYVGEHGRLNVVSYAALVVKWELLGDHASWWRWARVAEMLAICGGVYALFRRLDAGRFGAIAGASLFLVSRLSGEGWTRLTMGEPLGLALMLGAMLLACGWRSDPSVRRGGWIAVLIVLSILTKESLVGLVPLVWLIGLLRDADGRLTTPLPRAEAVRLSLWVGIPACITFGAAGLTILNAGGEGFGTLYSTSNLSFATFLEGVQRPWQIHGARSAPASWALPGNSLLLLLSLGGIIAAFRRPEAERRHLLWVAGAAVVMATAFSLLYLPWPFESLYYAMPFLIGPALLLAVGMTAIERGPAWGTRAARIAWAMMLLATLTSTERATHGAIAVERVNGDLTAALAELDDTDSIVVGRLSRPAYAWVGTAPRLRRYILATGLADTMPPMTDRLCDDVAELVRQRPPKVAIVSYLHWCGPLPEPARQFIATDPYLAVSWRGIDAGIDTFGVVLALPAPGAVR